MYGVLDILCLVGAAALFYLGWQAGRMASRFRALPGLLPVALAGCVLASLTGVTILYASLAALVGVHSPSGDHALLGLCIVATVALAVALSRSSGTLAGSALRLMQSDEALAAIESQRVSELQRLSDRVEAYDQRLRALDDFFAAIEAPHRDPETGVGPEMTTAPVDVSARIIAEADPEG